MMGGVRMFEQLNNLCAMVGYQFDALLAVPSGGFVCVLVDRLDGELEFKGETPQAAVQAAIDRLEVVSGSITH